MLNKEKIDHIIISALNEDVEAGDITTNAILDDSKMAKAMFIAKQNGIIAGLDVCERVFTLWDNSIVFSEKLSDGNIVLNGDIIAVVEGKAKTILTCERTALNFLQRMSGIATLASKYVEIVKGTDTKILDTRKTAPGLRYFDKLAVKIGGADNHRYGLFDMFLIKDNHIDVAGSITEAVSLCRNFMKTVGKSYKIEVETKNLDEVKEALTCKADIIMLDNFSIDAMKEAVLFINKRCKVEASGGITIDNLRETAEAGVDFISVGALTHSVKGLDISLLTCK